MQLESWEKQWKDLSLLQQVILLNEITQAWKELFVYLFIGFALKIFIYKVIFS